MVFGLSTSSFVIILLVIAVIFFVAGFFVRKFLKWLFILGVLILLVAGWFWFF